MDVYKSNGLPFTKIFFLPFCLFVILFFFLNSISYANPQAWQQWVKNLRTEAIAQGIRPEIFDDLFADIHEPNRTVLHFDRTQPEKRITIAQYRKSRADNFKLILGQQEYKRYQPILTQVGKDYAVDPCFIVALWGMESSYGRYMGNFPVIRSLATLAYDNRRAPFFRRQLLIALHIVNEGHVLPQNFKGEWAGASGHPQFLPSSWQDYAVDYDHDGRRDIWTSKPDVFASIANYLKQHGWQANEAWGMPVQLPANFNKSLADKNNKRPLGEWINMGIQPLEGKVFPQDHNLNAAIILPDGGPAYLIFDNFRVLMSYNNSIYYAATVGYMADRICKRN